VVLNDDASVIAWLLGGDPAIRWQALRDLLGAAKGTVDRERRKVVREGWGGRLLALQDRNGGWGGGLYNPKWTSTTYTMLLLRDLGLPQENPQAGKACLLLLDKGLRADCGINFGPTERSETCITGMVLSVLSYFWCDDGRLNAIADHLMRQQMSDGGWNCRRSLGATHASVHTTLTVLEGLRQYELFRNRRRREVRVAQGRGREFLLDHRLFRSHRTGGVIKSEFTRLSFPPRWHYDILRALDFFQSVGASRDERLSEAIEIVRSRHDSEGRWPLQNRHAGKTFFELEQLGAPSRWNTLRALRVLKWWDGGSTPRSARSALRGWNRRRGGDTGTVVTGR
jgi:hypothetical protein